MCGFEVSGYDAVATDSPDHVLAVDLGGSRVKIARVTREGRALEMRYEPTPGRHDHPDALEHLRSLVRRETSLRRPSAVGVAVPGLVEEGRGVVRAASNLGWRDLELLRLLAPEASCPVVVGHDVRAGALAEARAGAGRSAGSFVFVAVGTGIAAAVVFDGHPWAGAHSQAGEIGHLVVRPGGEPCACGRRGCVEALASAAAISRRYAAASGQLLPAQEVIKRVPTDSIARMIWEEAIEVLAEAILALHAAVDPELVVLGGGLSLAGAAILMPLREACTRRGAASELKIVAAELGDGAGWRGAAMLAWDRVALESSTI